jgi:hypothetical protein
MGYRLPFDRHDWTVDRCGTKVCVGGLLLHVYSYRYKYTDIDTSIDRISIEVMKMAGGGNRDTSVRRW